MRRGLGRGRRLRQLLGAVAPSALGRANQLVAAGNYAEGADALERIARAAGDRGGRRAAAILLEAGRARILATQTEAGLGLLREGLALLAVSTLPLRFVRVRNRVVEELRLMGLEKEAQQIGLYDKGPVAGMDPAPPLPSHRQPTLPTHCPNCGAPVRPDEIEWLDAITAECAFCGSPVRGV